MQVDGDPSLSITRRIVRPRGDDRSILIPHAQAQTPHGARATRRPRASSSHRFRPARARWSSCVPTSPADVGTVTVHVPADSVFVFAHAAHGTLDVHDYKSGTLLAFVGHGRLTLDDVGGTVFAQTNRGPLVVRNSNFDRIRARSLIGNMAFERCNVRQIEATSVAGSIVYDGGSFAPGLGALRIDDAATSLSARPAPPSLGARTTGGGHVFTDFANGTRVDAQRRCCNRDVDGGGPVVTATSASGNVYLYGGSLRRACRVAAGLASRNANARRSADIVVCGGRNFRVPLQCRRATVQRPAQPADRLAEHCAARGKPAQRRSAAALRATRRSIPRMPSAPARMRGAGHHVRE